jgi:hypothetical protein
VSDVYLIVSNVLNTRNVREQRGEDKSLLENLLSIRLGTC